MPAQTIKPKLRFKIANAILAVLFIISMFLAFLGINIYRLMIIPLIYLFIVVFTGSIATFILILYGLRPSYKTIWIFLTSIAVGGGSLCFLFLFLNSIYPGGKKLIRGFNIIRTGTLGKADLVAVFSLLQLLILMELKRN